MIFINKKNKNEILNKKVKLTLVKTIKTIETKSVKLLVDGRLAVTSLNLVLIFNLSNFKCEMTITEDTNINNINVLSNGKLLIQNEYLKIYVLTKTSYKCDFISSEFKDIDVVQILELDNNTMVTYDITPCLIFINTNKPYNILNKFNICCHTYCDGLYYCKNKQLLVLIFEHEPAIIFWNLKTHQRITTIDDLSCPYHEGVIQLDENRLLVPSTLSIYTICLRTFRVIRAIRINKEPLTRIFEMEPKLYLCQIGNKLFFSDARFYRLKYCKNFKEEIKEIRIINSNMLALLSNTGKHVKLWKISNVD